MSEMFAKFIKTDEITFKYTKRMRDILGKEIHTYNEIFFFMGKSAQFIWEKHKKNITPNTVVIIPKGCFHQFIAICKEEEYHRCVLNFNNVRELNGLISDKLDRVYLIENAPVADIFRELAELTDKKMDQKEKNILLKAHFARILVELETQGTVLRVS